MKGFTTVEGEGRQTFDDAPTCHKKARADLEKGNGNPTAQRPNRTKDYRDVAPLAPLKSLLEFNRPIRP